MFWLKRDAALPTPALETPVAVVPLTSYAGFERDPCFSPDGSQVAFSWAPEPEAPYDSNIYIKQVGSEALFRLTTDKDPNTDPAWSPDGRWIAFLRQRSPQATDIYVMSAQGGRPRRLTAGGGPYYSRDGKWIYFEAGRTGQSRIYRIRPEGGEIIQVTSLCCHPTVTFSTT